VNVSWHVYMYTLCSNWDDTTHHIYAYTHYIRITTNIFIYILHILTNIFMNIFVYIYNKYIHICITYIYSYIYYIYVLHILWYVTYVLCHVYMYTLCSNMGWMTAACAYAWSNDDTLMCVIGPGREGRGESVWDDKLVSSRAHTAVINNHISHYFFNTLYEKRESETKNFWPLSHKLLCSLLCTQMFVYTYIHIYIYIYTCVEHICMYVCINRHIYIEKQIFIYIYTYIYIYEYSYIYL